MASNSILVTLVINCSFLAKYKKQVAKLEAKQMLCSHSTGLDFTAFSEDVTRNF